jgi:hypothetical protein
MQLEPEIARRLKVLVARWSRINSFLGMKPESATEPGCMFVMVGRDEVSPAETTK